MKKTILLLPFLCLALLEAKAQTEPASDLSQAALSEPMRSLFQEALFAEEIDQDLGKAAEAYAEVLRLFGESRETAATAAYRLGEVHRKLAGGDPESEHHEKAARQYERVLREFSDIATLATLSEENLVAMGRTPPGPDPDAMVAGDAEAQRIRELAEWMETSPDKLTEIPTPLFLAASGNQLRVADFLIKSGVDIERGDQSVPPLYAAAEAGHLAMVESLLEAGASAKSANGPQPIHAALVNDRMAVVEKLLEVGAHLDARTAIGGTPLMALVRDPRAERVLPIERSLEYAALLTKAGADVNETNENGETALMMALSARDPGIVDWLLSNGARADVVRIDDGFTPLMLAVKGRDENLAKRLIDAGAEVNRTDKQGVAPLHHALASRANPKMVEMLLQAGAEVNQRIGSEGWTPLHVWAETRRNDEIGRMLYRAGGDPIAVSHKIPSDLGVTSRPSEAPFTPLSLRERGGGRHLPIVRELYEEGLKTLDPAAFAQAVWFLMPQMSNSKEHPRSAEAPTAHLPNLFPVFDRGESASVPPNLATLIVTIFESSGSKANPYQAIPRLDTVRILRPVAAADGGGKEWKTHAIPYEALMAKGEPSGDPPLRWGDVVLFDQQPGHGNAAWHRFDDAVQAHLYRAASVSFQLTLGDLTDEVRVVPKLDHEHASVAGDYMITPTHRAPGDGRNIRLLAQRREDLDFSAVRVRRKSSEGTNDFDLGLDEDATGSFFLQDGDEVVVPFRDVATGIALRNRNNYIWIGRPGTHILEIALFRSSFEARSVTSVPLARVLATCYASGGLPFPDFDKLRIDTSEGPEDSGKQVSLAEGAAEPVPWGAVVQIPMREGVDPGTWTGLSNEERALLSSLSKIAFTLDPEGMEKRQVSFEFSFREYRRGEIGELLRQGGDGRSPNVFSLFLSEFAGQDAKWDATRVVLESGGQSWELKPSEVPLFDGDIVKLFRSL